MSLRWTEEELEEYKRRIRETVERANGALRDTADGLRKFAEGEETSSVTASTCHLPHRGKTVEMVPTEDEEQMALFTWANHMAVSGHLPELSRLFHVPNGGSRGHAEAGRFKAMGVKRGVPDVFLDVPRGGFHGLRIEMKRRRGGVLSDEQADWIDYYNANGYRAVVCYGWDEARMEIEDYLRGGGEDG